MGLPIKTINCLTPSLEESGKVSKRGNARKTSAEIPDIHSTRYRSLPLPERQSITPCLACPNSQIEGAHPEKSVAQSSTRARSSRDSTKHAKQETARARRNKLHKTILLLSRHLLPQVKQLCKNAG